MIITTVNLAQWLVDQLFSLMILYGIVRAVLMKTEINFYSELNLPWFYRQIPLATIEDIETRIFHDEEIVGANGEDILVE